MPHAGLGFGTPLLDWLRRYVFPLEHDFTEAVAEVVAPAVFRAFAAAGTTTAVMYGAVYEPSLDAAFRAAEAHGIRAVIGKVMMDRLTYDETRRPSEVLDLVAPPVVRPVRSLAHARQRPAALRVHAPLRGLVQRRDAP